MPNKGVSGKKGVRRGDQKGDHPTLQEALKLIAEHGKCPTHPRYARKRKPTSTCQNCWFLYFLVGLISTDDSLQFKILPERGE